MPYLSQNNKTTPFRTSQYGFTIIELTMVIVIISIIGAVAMPRFQDNNDFKARQFTDNTISALRYAQKLAIAAGCHVQISFTTTGYTLKQRSGNCTDTGNSFDVDVVDPTFSPDTPIASNTLPTGLPNLGFYENVNGSGYSGTGPLVYYYDNIGRPVDSATDTLYRNTVYRIDIGPKPISIYLESITGLAHQ